MNERGRVGGRRTDGSTDRPTDIDHGCMIIGNPSEAG